jgi:hypothetical protein
MADAIFVWDGTLKGHYHIEQPSSSSFAERQQAAQESLVAEGHRKIAVWNESPLPQDFVFQNVRVVRIINEGSETKTNWTAPGSPG